MPSARNVDYYLCTLVGNMKANAVVSLWLEPVKGVLSLLLKEHFVYGQHFFIYTEPTTKNQDNPGTMTLKEAYSPEQNHML